MKKTFFYFAIIISIICFSSSTVYATQNTYNSNVEANIFDTVRGLLRSIQEQFVAAQKLFTMVVIKQEPLVLTPLDKDFEDRSVSFFDIGAKNEISDSSRERYQQIPLVPGAEDVSRGRTFQVDTEVNDAPFFSSIIKSRTIRPEQEFTFFIQAEDLEQDELTYQIQNLPPGAKFDTKTGKFTWKPNNALVGNTYIITVVVKDSRGKETIKKMRLSVEDFIEEQEEDIVTDDVSISDNRAPLFNSIDSDIYGVVGEEITFTLSATDEDDDPITYSAKTSLPSGATLSSKTGEFVWTPNASQIITDKVLKFQATDSNGASDYKEIVITVESNIQDDEDNSDVTLDNYEPVLNHIGNKVVKKGEKLIFDVHATDGNGDTLSFDAIVFPDNNYDINAVGNNKWRFSWMPGNEYSDGDTVDVIFAVNDGELEDSESITITIKDDSVASDINHAPRFINLPSVVNVSKDDENFVLHITGDDDDGDFLDITTNNNNAEILGTGSSDLDYTWDFKWIPNNVGTTTIKFSLYDGTTTTIQSVAFRVSASSCSLPKLSPSFDVITLPTNITVGEAIQFPVRAHLPNEENIYLTVKPEKFLGMSFLGDSENTKIFSLVPQAEYAKKNISFTFTAVGNECTVPKTKIVSFYVNSATQNNPPQFSETIILQHTIREMTEIVFDVVARDINNDPISYGVINMPQGAITTLLKKDGENSNSLSRRIITFFQQANLLQDSNSSKLDPSFKDLGTGDGIRFSWTPALGQGRIDPYVVTFRAYDGKEESLLRITITVNKNNSPQFNGALSSQIMIINTQSSFTIPSASDSDGDTIQYALDSINPSSSISPSFSPITRLFSWIPPSLGSFVATFSAKDNKGGTTLLPVTITVRNQNRTPLFSSDTPQNVSFQVGVPGSFTVLATDADNDVLTYSWNKIPSGATFNNVTRTFTWIPKSIGTYYAEFTVDDNHGGNITTSVQIIVTALQDDSASPKEDTLKGNAISARLETILKSASFNILNFFKHLFIQ